MSVGGGGDVAEGGGSRRGVGDPGADLKSPNQVWGAAVGEAWRTLALICRVQTRSGRFCY